MKNTKLPTFVSFEVKVVTNAGTASKPVRCNKSDVMKEAGAFAQEKKSEIAEYNAKSTVPLRIERVEIVIPAEQMSKAFGA